MSRALSLRTLQDLQQELEEDRTAVAQLLELVAARLAEQTAAITEIAAVCATLTLQQREILSRLEALERRG